MIFGEMRHGVAAGVMVKAIAQAAGATLKEAQRAAMFCGDLGELARIALKEGKDGLQAIARSESRAYLLIENPHNIRSWEYG